MQRGTNSHGAGCSTVRASPSQRWVDCGKSGRGICDNHGGSRMSTGHIEFTRGAIRPFQCLSDGWQLIKDRYWLFLGITVVGVLIGSLAPLGILMGPCMCGIHYCMIRQQEGKSVEFGMLFKGFDYFVQSLIATLIMLIPMMILIIPFYIVFLIVMLKAMPDQRHNPHPDPKALMTFF